MIGKLLKLLKHRREVRMALASAVRLAEGDENAAVLGGLTDSEIAGLVSWLPDSGTFVEFGTLFGLTAKAIAAAKPRLRIVAVDNFSWNPFGISPDLHEAFARRILSNEISSGQIEVFRADSVSFRSSCKDVPSAVFFDALHQYEPVRDEILWARSLGIPCISGHDYGNPSPVFGVTRAVDEIFGPSNVDVVGMCWRARLSAKSKV